MSNHDNLNRRLSEGVASWLLFELNCKRGELFSEKYLASPIGNLLTSQLGVPVLSEVEHPLLKREGPGNKKKIDFAKFSSTGEIGFALETKWFSRREGCAVEVFFDILRLAILKQGLSEVRCLFLLSGKYRYLQRLFAKEAFLTGKTNQPILLLDDSRTHSNLSLDNLSDPLKKGLDKWREDHPNILLPRRITITRPHIYPPAGSHINMSFPVYVWEILKIN